MSSLQSGASDRTIAQGCQHVLRAAAILIQRRRRRADDRQIARSSRLRRRKSPGSACRDGGASRACQSSRGRAQSPARGDEAVRLRHGDPRGLP